MLPLLVAVTTAAPAYLASYFTPSVAYGVDSPVAYQQISSPFPALKQFELFSIGGQNLVCVLNYPLCVIKTATNTSGTNTPTQLDSRWPYSNILTAPDLVSYYQT